MNPQGAAAPRRPQDAQAQQTARYVNQLKVFRDRLLDLNGRNPSLLVRKTTQKTCFDVRAAASPSAPAIIQKLGGGGEVLLIATADESPSAISSRRSLVQLRRNDEARAEETGLRDLYVGLCWLEGFATPDTFLRAPLVLAPAELLVRQKQRQSGHVVVVREGLTTNRALLSALRKHRGFSPADGLAEQLEALLSDAGGDEATLHAAMGALWLNAGLPAQLSAFNANQTLEPLTNDTIQLLPRDGLKLTSALCIGMFPQTSTALFADLDQMVARAMDGETDQGIVDNLLEVPGDDAKTNLANFAPISLDDVPDAQLNLVMQSDPSQDAVVVRAQQADCVVVRGPPGTGKSQVIVNLIADSLSRGERVCVVCQKRAALDVVHARLRDVGLGDHAYLVHDEAVDRPNLYQQMQRALLPSVPNAGPADIATMSNAIDADVRSLREIAEPLGRLFHGVQLSSLYRRARHGFVDTLGLRGGPNDDKELDRLCALLKEHKAGFVRYDSAGTAIAMRRSWRDVGGEERAAALRAIDGLAQDEVTASTALVRVDAREQRTQLDAALAESKTWAGRWYRWLSPRWWAIRRTLTSARNMFGSSPQAQWSELLSRSERAYAALDAVARLMNEQWRGEALARMSKPGEFVAWLLALRPWIAEEFTQIQQHDLVRKDVDPGIVEQCLRGGGAESDWADLVTQSVTLRWIEEAERRHPALRGDPLKQYEMLKKRLTERLDAKRRAVAAQISTAVQRRALSPGEAIGNASARAIHATRSKLQHEVTKKRQLKPLRALIGLYDAALRPLTPCWLASPEVVAEVFPLQKDLFDLIIFDEASQLTVERALPILYRAKRVVIAGDEQQMPPSNFFGASVDDESDDDEEEVAEALQQESLLVLAKRIYGFSYLGWHYRSERKELIDFSNHAFYSGTLNIAANVDRAEQTAPIRWIPVNGVWHDNKNVAEAVAAVDLLDEHLAAQTEKPRSIGIITFNQKQTDAIKDEIEKRRGLSAEFAARLLAAETLPSVDARPFVKNIENVQGDERDVIVFSVGYGRTPEGRFRRAFGPVGQVGGENRLNVAVTRAKRQIAVLCSFELELLSADSSKNLGPKRFRQYLEYAKAIAENDTATLTKTLQDINPEMDVRSVAHALVFESPFEEQVYNALKARGYQLETQVGLSGYRIDLAVIDPNDPTKFCLGIECDGASFHSGKSVRERDVARQRFLESRGWKIARIWSRNWWVNPRAEVDRIVAHLPTRREAAAPAPEVLASP